MQKPHIHIHIRLPLHTLTCKDKTNKPTNKHAYGQINGHTDNRFICNKSMNHYLGFIYISFITVQVVVEEEELVRTQEDNVDEKRIFHSISNTISNLDTDPI